MYRNLINIGLEHYLDSYFCNNNYIDDKCIENINNYVGTLEEAQKKILLEKFQNQRDLTRLNDMFYELWIAYVYHQNAFFQDEQGSVDMIDSGVSIEVKNINTTPEELDRIKDIKPGIINTGPFPREINIEERFKERFERHFIKAEKQLNNNGIIYLIWDTTLYNFDANKEKITRILNNLIKEKQSSNPNIKITHCYFGDLKRKVETQAFNKTIL